LSDARFDMEKVDPSGSEINWNFKPTWLQVKMDNPPEHHSQQLTTGNILPPEERPKVADALLDALYLRRNKPPDGAPT
jgi:uncharacterized membrane protein